MKALRLLLALSLPLCAQFTELASTDDGRHLYFTSTLTLAGAPPISAGYAVYRITETGAVELFAPGARLPQVSGNGQTVGVTAEGQGQLRGARAGTVGPGVLALSRNARWATLTQAPGPMPANLPARSVLVDLDTGLQTVLPGAAIGFSPIASDGTVVLQGPSAAGLWRHGAFAPVALTGPFSIFGISDDARVLVYAQLSDFPSGPQQRIVARDLTSGSERLLLLQPLTDGAISPMAMSRDGARLLYRVASSQNAGRAFLSGAALPLPEGELAVDGTLSGDGNVAFLITTTGRLVSFDVNGPRTLIPQTWFASDLAQPFTPGSLVRLRGNLPGRTFLDELSAPVLFRSDSGAGIQVPWELAGRTEALFRLEGAAGSPFYQSQRVPVTPMYPRFEPLAPGETSALGAFKAIAGDFSGLLTTHPHPSDVIIVYATGLGPVRGTVRTGEPAPTGRLIEIEGQIRCGFFPYPAVAETLFAGLAPGFTGIYQINFRLPPGPYLGPITGGVCDYSGAGVTGGFSWVTTTSVLPRPSAP